MELISKYVFQYFCVYFDRVITSSGLPVNTFNHSISCIYYSIPMSFLCHINVRVMPLYFFIHNTTNLGSVFEKMCKIHEYC